MSKNDQRIESLAICGGGLAAHMTAAVLSRHLAPSIKLYLVGEDRPVETDIFYGTVSAPSLYTLNLSAGISEPDLLLKTATSFSFGTCYDWLGRNWVQAHQGPEPVFDGVPFHHYLTRFGRQDLQPFLVAAVAGRRGVFAHPPQSRDHLLSAAEYGYQFDPYSLSALFRAAINSERVERISGNIVSVETNEKGIGKIHLDGNRRVTADLVIDCTDPRSGIQSLMGREPVSGRSIVAFVGEKPAPNLGPSSRKVASREFGWTSETFLRDKTIELTVCDAEQEESVYEGLANKDVRRVSIHLSQWGDPWADNCVRIGHGAGVLEPLTPAPMLLLQRDIERLLDLIPLRQDMSMERREYNRQYGNDYFHASMFNRQFFEAGTIPETPYWTKARSEVVSEQLARKQSQFVGRGSVVMYDLEPFNQEDWLCLFHGIGLVPHGYDRFADKAPQGQVEPYLDKLQAEIAKVTTSMPTHAEYLNGMVRYLEKKGLGQ